MIENDGLDFDFEAPPELGDHAQFGLEELIGRYADLQGQLEKMGATGLIARAEELKATIKKRMMSERREAVTDEVSYWGANLSVRTKDVWDPELVPERYRILAVDTEAVKQAIKDGVLSRPAMEEKGAVTKELYSIAIRIAPRKREQEDGGQD